jgi:hypothetical protein
MPTNISVENNFIGGLKTEFTGLNFPENACTQAENCVFSIIGDVLRREGIDFEQNKVLASIDTTNKAVNYYKWNNAGGDGTSQIFVVQTGHILNFFFSSQSTTLNPISNQLLTATVDLNTFLVVGQTGDPSTIECQFADGNGYLFVFNPFCEPFFVQFTETGPAITTASIPLQIRDFNGLLPEPGNPAVNFRPTTLTFEHNYNLQNQGWTGSSVWSASSNTANLFFSNNGGGSCSLLPLTTPQPATAETFTVASGLSVTLGTPVSIKWSVPVIYQATSDGDYSYTINGTATGNVTAYSGTSMTINVVTSTSFSFGPGSAGLVSTGTQTFSISSSNVVNTISTWNTQIGNYPSNADVWFDFITPDNVTTSSPGTFAPSTMIGVVPLGSGQAPQGHFLFNPFNQDRTLVSGISGINPITTLTRPRLGCWFQGRVWYSGVDASQLPTANTPFYTWTENLYFSQIVSGVQDFGKCHQANDPTDSKFFDLEADDGGVIVIQGAGAIYKLFPIQNGLLVFAANGVWLIRGNSGLGFTANDYSINKISAVKSISSSSFIDVLGLPFFWNNEGIYRVAPSQAGAPYQMTGFEVDPLTVGTILSFYNQIPITSKLYARGTYDPISYVLTWVYRSTNDSGLSNRYQFDSALNLNIFNRAFYPYTLPTGTNTVCGVNYIDYPTGTINPSVKYLTASGTQFTFSEELDNTTWTDFFSFDGIGKNYISSFTTGYRIHGQAFKKFQPIYLTVYARNFLPPRFYVTEDANSFYVTEDGTKFYIPEEAGTSAYGIMLTLLLQAGLVLNK